MVVHDTFTVGEMKDRASSARRGLVLAVLATAVFLVLPWDEVFPDEPFRGPGPGLFALAILGMGACVWAFVRWVMWFHAVHEVAVVRGRARFTGGWWVWAWLIPLVSAVLPYLMVKDLWRAGDPPGTERRLPSFFGWWWACWVAVEVAGYLNRGDNAHATWFFYEVQMVATVLGLALAVRVVPLLTDRAIAIRAAQSDGVEPPSTATVQPVT